MASHHWAQRPEIGEARRRARWVDRADLRSMSKSARRSGAGESPQMIDGNCGG
jgi:hypothetical protein